MDATRCAIKADGQTAFLKQISKDYHGEIVAKVSELVRFRILGKQPKLAE